jgi:predicted Zn-dependent peptidase
MLDGFPTFFFSSPIHTARTFASAELNRLPRRYYERFREEVAAVTPEVVSEMARKYCRRDRFVFLFVGNIPAISKGDETHKIKLSEFGPVTAIPLPDPLTLERPR